MNEIQALRLGISMFRVDDVVMALNITWNEGTLERLIDIPFSEAQLRKWGEESRILVPVIPYSISKMNENGWVDNRLVFGKLTPKFVFTKGEAHWHCLSKGILPNSTNKIWLEQCSGLSITERVAPARVVAYAAILQYLINGRVTLFEGAFHRCPEMILGGDRIYLYFSNYDGKVVFGSTPSHTCEKFVGIISTFTQEEL